MVKPLKIPKFHHVGWPFPYPVPVRVAGLPPPRISGGWWPPVRAASRDPEAGAPPTEPPEFTGVHPPIYGGKTAGLKPQKWPDGNHG